MLGDVSGARGAEVMCHSVQVVSILDDALTRQKLTISANDFLWSKIHTLPELPYCMLDPMMQVLYASHRSCSGSVLSCGKFFTCASWLGVGTLTSMQLSSQCLLLQQVAKGVMERVASCERITGNLSSDCWSKLAMSSGAV